VLTNLHVVGSAPVVAVVFKPSIEGAQVTKADIHRGTVVRRDQITDLALVQVADLPANVTTIRLGAMADISVGSDVHAIGHPTGEAWSYTKGIVSQVRRNYEWRAEDGLKHTAFVIQTQTPINPGNSGGPLLTDEGTLVGVNSFKAEGEGLNFAVSVDDVRTLLAEKSDRLIRAKGIASTCSPKSYGVTRLKDGSGTIELFDADCFGKPDAQVVIPDDPTKPARLEVDPNHTGQISGIYFSKHRDGKWDYSIWDTTGNGKADLRCFHKDGSATPTRCEKISD
jgi:S1-C subfamily serine protease